uniref:Uncharacterized protein n=1 Tax=Avena sativa TaxID=4498 RepID=A0ACD5YEV1_AVESA
MSQADVKYELVSLGRAKLTYFCNKSISLRKRRLETLDENADHKKILYKLALNHNPLSKKQANQASESMVNFVQVLRDHFVDRLGKSAGLRQHAIAVDDAGTVINFWVPKHRKEPEYKQKHAVVLVHGFAGDGMMTWGFQVGALAKRGYHVYVPDLVHFGGSTSPSPDRSVAFHARCIAAGLAQLGVVGRCTVVGFSYGGLVAFEMAAAFPVLVRAVVVSGAVVSYTASMNDAVLRRFGVASITDLMLPDTLRGVARLLTTAFYKEPWLPRRLLKDFQKVMFSNRNERGEMLEDMIVKDNAALPAPVFQQNILLLWAENDNFFPLEMGKRLKEDLGEKTTLRSIRKAGHLAHLERPCVYNRSLKKFLDQVDALPSSN